MRLSETASCTQFLSFGSEEQLCVGRIISNHFGFGQELFVKGADVTCRGAGKAKNSALNAVPADVLLPL
ncbi:MAG: hypothetical protein ACKO81_06585 [Planctomycetota bacterium]